MASPHDELIGQTVDLLVPTSLRAQHARHRSQFAPHPAIRLARNLSGRRKDGTEFPAEVGLNQIPTNEGFLVLAVIVDISERFRIESLKHEFIATVSHELRTPLTSIAGALSLLVNDAGGTLPARAMRLLTIARANGQRLVRPTAYSTWRRLSPASRLRSETSREFLKRTKAAPRTRAIPLVILTSSSDERDAM